MPATNEPATPQNQSLYQVLSIDVVLGSVAVGLFFAKLLNVNPHPVWWIVLPLAVWAIYSADHLIDGWKGRGKSNIFRHRFHFRHRRKLIALMLVCGLVSVLLSIFFLEKEILIAGTLLSVFVACYFIISYFKKHLDISYLHKEALIAIIYVSGILLAPWVWSSSEISSSRLAAIIVLVVLVWTEGVMNAWFDYQQDLADRLSSFAIKYGLKTTRNVLIAVHITLTISILYSLIFTSEMMVKTALLIELVMAAILFSVILFPRFFENNNLFRWIGESVFILPAVIYFF